MDYIGSKCPVCNKYFHADEDVVVCPDCGTPHHRGCYESLGRCCYEDRHGEGFTYSADDDKTGGNVVLCRSCGKENDKSAFFCKYCAAPLSKEDEHKPNDADAGQQPRGANGVPFGNGAAVYMDPLGGIPADTDMGDDITAGEMAKYVKQNTPYFIRVFNNIKTFNHSKFNFCAALFSGGYLLYRKMYKIGALLTALQFGMMILSSYITIRYQAEYQTIANRASNAGSMTQMFEYFTTLAKGSFVLCIPLITNIVTLVMRIVIGAVANRMYFKHCKQQITLIKAASNTQSGAVSAESPENALQTRGGVNMPLAFSLLITNLIISYLPNIIGNLF